MIPLSRFSRWNISITSTDVRESRLRVAEVSSFDSRGHVLNGAGLVSPKVKACRHCQNDEARNSQHDRLSSAERFLPATLIRLALFPPLNPVTSGRSLMFESTCRSLTATLIYRPSHEGGRHSTIFIAFMPMIAALVFPNLQATTISDSSSVPLTSDTRKLGQALNPAAKAPVSRECRSAVSKLAV